MNRLARIGEAIPALTLLCYLLISEEFAVLLLFLAALALHEWGHITAFRLIKKGAPSLYFEGVGTRLAPKLPLLPREEAIVVISGPLTNILFALLFLRFGQGGFFLIAAIAHLLFAIGNLFPFGGTDGERLLRLLLYRFFPGCAEHLLSFISTLFLALFFYFSLFLFYLTGNGLSGVMFALFFFFSAPASKNRKNS